MKTWWVKAGIGVPKGKSTSENVAGLYRHSSALVIVVNAHGTVKPTGRSAVSTLPCRILEKRHGCRGCFAFQSGYTHDERWKDLRGIEFQGTTIRGLLSESQYDA